MTSIGVSDQDSLNNTKFRQNTVDRTTLADYRKRQTDGFSSKYSHTDGAKKRQHSEMQILNEIDIHDDPKGRQALRKIDFTRGGISVGRKEFLSKNEAFKALEVSKHRVSEIMQQARSMHLNSFKKSVGKTVKADHFVAAMPRIRISAAKSHLRANTLGGSSNNLSPINANKIKVVGGLTSGNLSKIPDNNDNIGGGIQGFNTRLEEHMKSGEFLPKQRKNYARGISHQQEDKKGSNQLRHLSELAPSAHHRFDKDQVHLRYMYRQLHPVDGHQTRNKLNSKTGQLDSASHDSAGGDYRVPVLDRNSGAVHQGYATSFTRRDDRTPELARHQKLGSTMQTQSSQRIYKNNGQGMDTTSLLQNTPQAVDLHRSNYLQRGRTLSHMMNTKKNSPNKNLNLLHSNISQHDLQIGENNSQISIQQRFMHKFSPQTQTKKFLESTTDSRINITNRKTRPQPRVVYKQTESSDEDEKEQFIPNPAEDIPRNKLVDKLVRGLQGYIQRMQKRENFRIDVQQPFDQNWLPAPRECSTLTTVGFNMYLIGGLNMTTCKEISCAKINGGQIIWERIPYTSIEPVQGRQCHSSVTYNNKIYTFGGCFMFNPKRQVRECTNQLLEFDVYARRMSQCKTSGYSAGARKSHCATVYKKSMIIYGGVTESGVFQNEMIVCHLEYMEWMKINLKSGMAPFVQGACVTVNTVQQQSTKVNIDPNALNLQRQSDTIQEGVYYFGGKNQKGELQNRLRYFKPVVIDSKVVHGEFVQIKTQGMPPVPRFGHTMQYLPCNNSILIAGGRNDSLSATNMTPFLNDLVLFLLDQKVWLHVKHSMDSTMMAPTGNHSMGIVTDSESYERILIFGGIANQVGDTIEEIKSSLSNKAYLITVTQRNQTKSLFKENENPMKMRSNLRNQKNRPSKFSVASVI